MNGSRTNLATLLTAVLATSVTFIDATAVNQALPAISDALHASTFQSVWVIGGFALTLAVLLLPAGAVADRFGRRAVLALGLIVFALASMACAAATDANGLIAARVVQGVGGAMIVPASLAVLTGGHASQQRGRVIGVWSSWCAVATVAGPLLGGILGGAGLWRGIFLVNVPLATVALLCLHATPRRAEAPAGERMSMKRPLTWVPPALWHGPAMRSAAGATVLLYTAMYGLMLILPLALIAGAGYRADHAAIAQLPLVVMLIAVCPLAGRWVDRCGPRTPVCVGCGLATAGLGWLALGGTGAAPGGYVSHLLVPLFLLGVGMGLCIVPLSTTVMNHTGDAMLAAGGALNALLARLAAAIAAALFGGLILGGGVALSGVAEHDAAAWPATFRIAMILTAMLCMATGVLAAWRLPSRGQAGLPTRSPVMEARP